MLRKQIIKFLIVGVISAVINYGCFYLLLVLSSIGYLLASAAGYIAGIFLGYFLNKQWTFAVKDNAPYIGKYALVYISSLIISLVFLKITVGHMELIAEVANILAIGLTTCTNFIGMKFFVFTPNDFQGKRQDV